MNIRSILTDSVYSMFRITITIFKGIIYIYILTNWLSEEAYGVWATVFAIIGISTVIGNFHLQGSLIRYMSTSTNNRIFSNLLSISIFSSISMAIIVYYILSNGLILSSSNINFLGPVGIAAIPIIIIAKIHNIMLINLPRSLGEIRSYEFLYVMNILAELVAVIISSIYFNKLSKILLSIGFIIISLNTLYVFMYRDHISVPDFQNTGQHLRFSIPMVPRELSKSVITNADKIIISIFVGPIAVAIYAACLGVGGIISKLTNVITPTLYPQVVEAWESDNHDAVQDAYYDLYAAYAVVGIPSVFGLILVSNDLLTLISTERIAEKSLVPIIGLSVAMYLKGYANMNTYVFTAREETQKLGGVNLIGAGSNVVLNLVLVPIWGIAGAVLASIMTAIIISGYTQFYVLKYVGASISNTVVFFSAVSSLLMFVILQLFPLESSPLVNLLGHLLFGIILYFGIFYILAQDELLYLKNKLI